MERFRGVERGFAAGLAGVRAAWAELQRAVFPPLCWLCASDIRVDDSGCSRHALSTAGFAPEEPRCEGCANLLPRGMSRGLCALCRRSGRGFRRLVALGPYRPGGVLREWILAWKHGARRELTRPLALALAGAWVAAGGPEPGAWLTSVPLHPLRRLERGFDQAGLLAAELARELDLPQGACLRRARWTAPQGAPGARSRNANVTGAFVPRRVAAQRLAGRPVWLVDDVVTSGATVRACAEALRRAGADQVSVLALARAELEERDPGEGADTLAE